MMVQVVKCSFLHLACHRDNYANIAQYWCHTATGADRSPDHGRGQRRRPTTLAAAGTEVASRGPWRRAVRARRHCNGGCHADGSARGRGAGRALGRRAGGAGPIPTAARWLLDRVWVGLRVGERVVRQLRPGVPHGRRHGVPQGRRLAEPAPAGRRGDQRLVALQPRDHRDDGKPNGLTLLLPKSPERPLLHGRHRAVRLPRQHGPVVGWDGLGPDPRSGIRHPRGTRCLAHAGRELPLRCRRRRHRARDRTRGEPVAAGCYGRRIGCDLPLSHRSAGPALGFRPARFWAVLAVGGELAAGVLFFLGLLTPLAGLLVLAAMAVAIATVHGPKGFLVQDGGFEYTLVLIIAALAVAAIGPGAFSLDQALGPAR